MGLQRWMRKSQNSSPRAVGEAFVSRKAERKKVKKLKKLQATAFAQRKPVEEIIKISIGGNSAKRKKKKSRTERAISKRLRNGLPLKSDSENESEEGSGDESDEEAPKRGNRILETTVTRRKRKFGEAQSSEDSDDDVTYEQYLKEVEEKKRSGLSNKEATKEDESAINRYGKLLGYKGVTTRDGRAKVPQTMRNDGLDLLLEFCDTEDRKDLLSLENFNKLEDDDVEEDEDGDENAENEEINLFDDDEGSLDDEDEDEEAADEEMDEVSDGSEEDDGEEGQNAVEDIYGRQVNRKTGELINFDPQAARKKLAELDEKPGCSAATEQRAKIDRTVTGLVNRLSESTVIKSKQSIAELWTNQSKNDVKSSICRVLSQVLNSSFLLQASLHSTYGLFVGLLHSGISNEISAHFVEVFLCDFVKDTSAGSAISLSESDKSYDNRAIFVAMLVNFKVIKPSVSLDVIDKLRLNLTANTIRYVSLIISYAYKTLKKSCWAEVNAKLDQMQEEFEKKPISSLTRAKVMFDNLLALKKAAPKTIDYSVIEHHQKIFQGLSKKEKQSGDEKELGMSLEDLLAAEERGRWWVVGSAFRLAENAPTIGRNTAKSGGNFSESLLEMASKAGMNSEVRRNVFCSIASAEDEDDAFEKLLRLALKGENEREIVHVVVAMMRREKKYNPFYAALLARFCEYNKRFLITLQYALWDRLRETSRMKPRERNHVASLLHHLIAREVVPITVLKVIEWGSLEPAQTSLLTKLFEQLAVVSQPVLRRIFEPLICETRRDKFEMLSEGLRVFLHMNFKGSAVYEDVDRWIVDSSFP